MELGATLWDFSLHEENEDDIVWKHTNNNFYLAESSYKAQFIRTVQSPFEHAVWKFWVPPKFNIGYGL